MIINSDKPRMPPPSRFASVNTRTKTNGRVQHCTQREQAKAFLHAKTVAHYDDYAPGYENVTATYLSLR